MIRRTCNAVSLVKRLFFHTAGTAGLDTLGTISLGVKWLAAVIQPAAEVAEGKVKKEPKRDPKP